MRDCEFWSRDRRYGARLTAASRSRLLAVCRLAGASETGGILIGYYTERLNLAVITTTTGPPPDSQWGRTWFHRGVQGLRQHLQRDWQEQHHYYLGEWHFHPDAAPLPSPTDKTHMAGIARCDAYQCPAPVLLILGGDARAMWTLGVYVFPVGQPPIELVSSV